MIAKHVPMKSVKKSDFASLVKYLADDQEKHERVVYTSVTNCESIDLSAAVIEVTTIQGMNTRAESDKTYHLILSFRTGERPDDNVLEELESRICEGLGYGEHQRVSVAHDDTDNFHLHIAINKIHPTRLTIHSPYNDHKTLGQLCEALELKYGLERDNHQSARVGSENRALDMEHHAGVESLLGWIKRECLEQLQAASSWAELHRVLQAHGLELKERGCGLVISDQDGLMVKASSVARELSKGKLVDRFGEFKSQTRPVTTEGTGKKYEARPVRSRLDTTLLFARYKNEQQGTRANRTQEWKEARAKRDRLIADVKRKARLKRATTQLAGGSRSEKKLLYVMTSQSVKGELNKINEQYRRERERLSKQYQPLQWADWLRREATKGDKEALEALRARVVALGLKGNTVSASCGELKRTGVKADQDGITKKGTIIYCVGSSAIRDDGDRLKVSRGATREGFEAALRLAMERYGSNITVNGTANFKSQIVEVAATANLQLTFTDSTLERKRVALVNHSTTTKQESNNDAKDRGRRTGSGAGGIGAAGRNAGAGRDRGRGNFGVGFARKPNIGSIAVSPPPDARNRLRNLSELGVVRFAKRSEMLLPGAVSGHLEQPGAQSDNALRRRVSRGELTPLSFTAADQYIEEREQKRLKILDIMEHRRYTTADVGVLAFAGVRRIAGESLALLKRNEVILVMPIDEKTANRLSRLAIGDPVTCTGIGLVKTKGRSR
ncbi:MAG: relaxase/mobilization nuclease domain-containing protein [Methylococcales bacterium]|nr:relaxase/mobilization nuclease domain-containing protein [Methylococcales bacterium]